MASALDSVLLCAGVLMVQNLHAESATSADATPPPQLTSVQATAGLDEATLAAELKAQEVAMLVNADFQMQAKAGLDEAALAAISALSQSKGPPPANDNCSGAYTLPDSLSYYFENTTNATDDAVSCTFSNTIYKGVWFNYTPTVTGNATVDTCGSSFDTKLVVLSGICGETNALGCNDDSLECGVQALFTFPCLAGATYRICAGGFGGLSGNLHIRAYSVVPPGNDTCSGAYPLPDSLSYYFEATTNASDDTLLPCTFNGTIYKGVWFNYTPTMTGTATVDTCGSSFDTKLVVLRGMCGETNALGCNDDSCGLQSLLSFPCIAGTTYRICAGGFHGLSGNMYIRAHSVAVALGSFTQTGMATLNGMETNAITLLPGGLLSGSFPAFARNRQLLPAEMVTIAGLVSSYGQCVSVPQVVYDGVPSATGDVVVATWTNMVAPPFGGIYKLRFNSYLGVAPALCVAQFSNSPPLLDTGVAQGLVATVGVTASFPWTLWFQRIDGYTALWQMDYTNAGSFQQWRLNTGPAGQGWSVVGTADFNTNGSTDLLWQNTNGWVAIWLLDGTNVLKQTRIGNAPAGPGWSIGATGDLDGDGHADILFQHTSGVTAVWFMNGTNVLRTSRLNALAGPGWRLAGAGRFGGGSHLDLLFQHSSGYTAVWFMDGTNRLGSTRLNAPPAGAGWQIVGAADVDHSGQTDILWQHDNGALAYWLLNGTNRVGLGRLFPSAVDPAWRVVGPR